MIDWQDELSTRLDTLGEAPTQPQCDALENWIIEHVPAIYWGDIAFHLPKGVSTNISMRAAESGF